MELNKKGSFLRERRIWEAPLKVTIIIPKEEERREGMEGVFGGRRDIRHNEIKTGL